VFRGLAARGKTSTGWFFGFKLHLIVNDRGELLNMAFTPGNVDDRKPVPRMVKDLFGKLFGDKGYLSQPLFQQLLDTFGIQLITKLKSNMKNQLMNFADKVLLRKRAIVETIIDQLKNISQIEHSRHRSPVNFLVNLLCGLIAYCHQPKKPSLYLDACLAITA
jgi:transposase